MIYQSQRVHPRRSDLGGFDVSTYPNVPKHRAIGALAVSVKILQDNCRYGHGHANKAIVIDSNPDDIEPSQAALGYPPNTSLPATALGKPINWQNPLLDRAQLSKEDLLAMQIGGHIMTKECEKGGDGERFVTVGNYLKVDGMPIPLKL